MPILKFGSVSGVSVASQLAPVFVGGVTRTQAFPDAFGQLTLQSDSIQDSPVGTGAGKVSISGVWVDQNSAIQRFSSVVELDGTNIVTPLTDSFDGARVLHVYRMRAAGEKAGTHFLDGNVTAFISGTPAAVCIAKAGTTYHGGITLASDQELRVSEIAVGLIKTSGALAQSLVNMQMQCRALVFNQSGDLEFGPWFAMMPPVKATFNSSTSVSTPGPGVHVAPGTQLALVLTQVESGPLDVEAHFYLE